MTRRHGTQITEPDTTQTLGIMLIHSLANQKILFSIYIFVFIISLIDYIQNNRSYFKKETRQGHHKQNMASMHLISYTIKAKSKLFSILASLACIPEYICDSSLAQDNLDRTSLVNSPGLICTLYMCRVPARPWPWLPQCPQCGLCLEGDS